MPRNLNTKYWLNVTEEKGVINVSPWLPWKQSNWLMPVMPRNVHTKYWLNTTEEKGVMKILAWLPWQLSYHSNEVAGWCLSCQGISMPNIDSIGLKKGVIKATELPQQRCSWLMLGNLCTKFGLNMTKEKGVIKISSWLPWQLSYHNNEVIGWCLLCQGTSIPNIDSIQFKTKELLRFHFGCHGNCVTIITR